MSKLARSICAGLVLLAFAAPPSGTAQQRGSTPGMNMHEAKSAAPYHPGLGELMTAFVQPRHIKLGLAGQAENWDYAAYELGELRETFDDIGKLDIAPAIASTVTPAIKALDAAIKVRDPAAFAKAYADLTTACNACHQSADHPMIVIQVPTVSAFPDQDFRPSK